VIHAGGCPPVIAAKLARTVRVKSIASQRWACRIQTLKADEVAIDSGDTALVVK
jgi:hypothetical protein